MTNDVACIIEAFEETSCTFARLEDVAVQGMTLHVLWSGDDLPIQSELEPFARLWPGRVEHFVVDEDGHEQTPWPGIPTRRLCMVRCAAA